LIPNEPIVLSRVCNIMEQHYTLTDPAGNERDWYIPVEAQTGWNLGHQNKTNPDGLIVYRDSDKRTRTTNPFDLESMTL